MQWKSTVFLSPAWLCDFCDSHHETSISPQVAYLASSLFLDHNSELIVLVVNTLQRDLADDNILVGAHSWAHDAPMPGCVDPTAEHSISRQPHDHMLISSRSSISPDLKSVSVHVCYLT